MTESGQSTAARNVAAILDAAEGMLARGAPINFSALAADAGVSRPTVYAHFPDKTRLLVAVVERNVSQAVTAIRSVDPDRGDPVDALRRVIHAGWEPLARHHAIGRAVATEITAESVHSAHHQAVALLARLIARGRRQGAFRADVPAPWLVTATFALIHAAASTVDTRKMTSKAALDALTVSVVDLCTGPAHGGGPATPG